MFHKPRPGPGNRLSGLVPHFFNPIRTRSHSNGVILCKFLFGILAGLVFAGLFQSLLLSSSSTHQVCGPLRGKSSSTPIRQLPRSPSSPDFQQKARVVQNDRRQLLMVGVMTADKYISTRAKAVFETWGQRVPGKILFFTSGKTTNESSTDQQLPVIRLKGVDDSYPPQKKSFMMLKYMYENYGNQFEWFMRADDDVFIRTELLDLFLRNVNSSQPAFIGQAGKGILEEFGLLSLEYDENFCMGGPGMIMSHVTLSRVAPNVKDCLKNLYTTHEDVELGRCVQKYAGIPCTWSYEMQNIFYHNSSGRLAFTGPLKSREVHRAITLHPIKEHVHMYRLHNYLEGVTVRDRVYEGLKIRREMAFSIEQLRKRLGPFWDRLDDLFQLQTLGQAPSLNKFLPDDESEILTWSFLARAVDSIDTINPRRSIDAPLREGVEDIIREVMESINSMSKERGRVIDFKELLYGYYRLDPRRGVDYILDLLLIYKKYRGRKMMFPVRRHAYLQQAFGPLVLRSRSSVIDPGERNTLIHFILPLSGRLPVFRRFMDNFQRVCVEPDEDVRLIVVLYPTREPEDPFVEIKDLVEAYRQQAARGGKKFRLQLIERSDDSFARAAAIELGVRAQSTDGLMVFIDVDMIFDSGSLDRIRTHTIRGRQVYFPIVFSQFDSSFNTGAPPPPDSVQPDSFRIDDDLGYWRFYGFGIASIYKSDLERVGGMNTTIRGWGQEDVDLYDRLVQSGLLKIFRAPDPGFIHVFHPVECDTRSLGSKQLKMCLGTRASTYASQQQLARKWIDHHPLN